MWLPFCSCAPQAQRYHTLLPQGTPLKYDSGASSTGSKKHDVRSIIGSPGRTFPPVHPLDVMADPRALERACYEESLKSRPGVVSSSGGSITRGAPVIVPELGKPRQSPLTYEDHGAPFAGHLPRGSPVSTRESTPRLQEGMWGVGAGGGRAGGGLLCQETTSPRPTFQSGWNPGASRGPCIHSTRHACGLCLPALLTVLSSACPPP